MSSDNVVFIPNKTVEKQMHRSVCEQLNGDIAWQWTNKYKTTILEFRLKKF